ncbi:winged helix-turn-helix transcriptional regulator [Leisingera sp. JC1]|uniref:winged helix-turn-helix transcriptional regulator n=1 Tax=Leisingera sp. JC1 TaxID=1855282 RepID=UPI000802F8D2|nr:winged helix-turn-helix transcriptional regulator [Leisingera sp. JC1]OBY26765.1 hypothetical protein A9D60_17395 [Leisingera sp. JC1]
MKRGFIRSFKSGPTLRSQKAALRAAGLDVDDPFGPVHSEDREVAIASLEPGDVLVVASASCLGFSARDVLEALSEIGKRGSSVLDLDTSETVSIHPDAVPALEFAARAESSSRAAALSRARQARRESGNLGQKPFEWSAEKIHTILQMRGEGATNAQISEAVGASIATLNRKIRELRDNGKLSDTSKKGAD